jgi:glycerol-3-phosphate acyltransferase PlsY
MMMYYVLPVMITLIAYLLGSVPTAIWIGKLFYGVDVREHGSRNAGATNTIRVLGYRAGIPVLLFDVFKGWLAVQLTFFIPVGMYPEAMLTWFRIVLAVAAVVGHVFPVYAGFRGGKGVGTLAGVGIALFPIPLLIVLGIFATVLAFTRYVSLASVLASVSFPFLVIFLTRETHPGLIILAVMVAVFVPLTHIKNIRRLIRGEENRFVFRKNKVDKG